MKLTIRPIMAMGAVLAAGAMITACGSDGGGGAFGGGGGGETVTGDEAQELVRTAVEDDKAVECTFADDEMEGVFYVKGRDLMRMDGEATETVETQDDDQFDMFTDSGEISMLTVGGKAYMWEPGGSEGMVMDLSEFQDEEMPLDFDELEDSEELECKPYKGGDKVFQAPSDVDFKDFGAIFADIFGGEDFGAVFDDQEPFDPDEIADLFDDPELQELLGQLPGGN